MSVAIATPYPIILSLAGVGLNGGSVYIGQAGQDPQSFPQAVYWDAALTIPASQPLTVTAGYPYYLGSPATPYTGGPYSIRVRDAQGVQVFYAATVSPAGANLPRGYIDGLNMSAPGSGSSVAVTAGMATDSTGATLMALASGLTKTTSAWAVGNSQGGLDTGTIATNTWYHWYLIERTDTGVVDVCYSSSASAPVLGTHIPTAYTLHRRIGSAQTDGSSNWLGFIQSGDNFTWLSVHGTGALTTSTTPTTVQVTAPSGIANFIRARFTCQDTGGGGANAFLVYSPLTGTQAANSPVGNAQVFTAANGFGAAEVMVQTNTSAQVVYVSSTPGTMAIDVVGWQDSRGRNA